MLFHWTMLTSFSFIVQWCIRVELVKDWWRKRNNDRAPWVALAVGSFLYPWSVFSSTLKGKHRGGVLRSEDRQ